MTDEVFDLDALASEGVPFRYRFGGEDYEMPLDIDLPTVAKLDHGDAEGALKAILGDEQWARMVASPHVFGVKSLMALLDAYAKHLGLENLGGLFASTDSSPNTAQR